MFEGVSWNSSKFRNNILFYLFSLTCFQVAENIVAIHRSLCLLADSPWRILRLKLLIVTRMWVMRSLICINLSLSKHSTLIHRKNPRLITVALMQWRVVHTPSEFMIFGEVFTFMKLKEKKIKKTGLLALLLRSFFLFYSCMFPIIQVCSVSRGTFWV